MQNIQQHIAFSHQTVRAVLPKLDKLATNAILFILDDNEKLVGALTDGDIRRGMMKGLNPDDNVKDFMNQNPKFFKKESFDFAQMQTWRTNLFNIIPVVNEEFKVIDIVNFNHQKSYLPIDAVIMAGGKGTRLRPLTLDTPKPLLKVGGKPIIEYNIDRLQEFGVRNLTLTIKYLGQQLIDYFGDGKTRNLQIDYITEDEPLGTMGAVSLIPQFQNDYILVMNSDLLTNINYEDMFKDLLEKDGDLVVATTPYEVQIPYGVIETEGDFVTALKEKPTYTYYSNAGIYIFKKEFVNMIPKGEFFNATDLIETLYTKGKKVIHYPILDYWLDIGKPHDFEKAQKDIKHIKF